MFRFPATFRNLLPAASLLPVPPLGLNPDRGQEGNPWK
jgi:hypothetical protein